MTQTSMTYGTLPKFEEFEAAFDREYPNGSYSVRLSSSDSWAVESFRLGDGDYNAFRLYSCCEEIIDYISKDYPKDEDTSRDDTAMNLVSAIMETLGFEWI